MDQILVIFPEIPEKFESPQWIYPNLTLVQLGTILKTADYRPIILNMPQNKLLDLPNANSIEGLSEIPIACISAWSFQLNVVRDLINRLKEQGMTVIIGGALTSTSPEEAVLYCNADFAIEGEGDFALPKLIDFLLKGDRNLDTIENVWYQENDSLKFTYKSYIKNLDELPIPDFKIQNFDELYAKIFKKMKFASFPLESSRGCYANCSFCSSKLIMGNWRKKSAQRLVDELSALKQTYPNLFKRQNLGINYIDNTMTADTQRVLEFAKLKQEGNLDISWACMSRVNELVDKKREVITEMVKSGNKLLFFGIEAGYDEGLKRINKGITIEQVNNTVKLCLDCKVPILNLSFIVGFPWETSEDVDKTISYAKKLEQLAPTQIKTSISPFILFKRTQIYADLKKEYAQKQNLDDYTSLDLINEYWNKNIFKKVLLQKIREFNRSQKKIELA